MALLARDGWPKEKRGHLVSTWLGEPIEIKPHTAALFRRQSRSNLLMIGQNKYEEDVIAMMFSSLMSIAAQQSPNQAKFMVFDFTDVEDAWHPLLNQVSLSFPHEVQVFDRKTAVGGIKQIAETVRKRTEEDLANDYAVYVFMMGLHRARDLRMDEAASFSFSAFDDPGSDKQSPSEDFKTISQDGSEVGVHLLVWCDTYRNLNRYFDRSSINEFEYRVALQMGANDSLNFIDCEAATNLGPHRGIFFDDERSGHLEKFRPYSIPTESWIEELSGLMKAKIK